MITKRFKVPIFNHTVTVCYIKKGDSERKIADMAKWMGLEKKENEEWLEFLDCGHHEGGYTYSSDSSDRILVILYQYDNYKELVNTMDHEKRHVVDRILEHCGIYDIETAAYISGFIAEYFDSLRLLIVEDKRKEINNASDRI